MYEYVDETDRANLACMHKLSVRSLFERNGVALSGRAYFSVVLATLLCLLLTLSTAQEKLWLL